MKLTKFVCARILLLGVSGAILVAQGVVGAQAKQGGKELKKVPITYSKPESGAQMNKDYCAACHGTEGRGDGPAVEFLKAAPPDLRTMAQRNSGKYPGDRVATIRYADLGAGVPVAGRGQERVGAANAQFE
jgi:hypothetical protein